MSKIHIGRPRKFKSPEELKESIEEYLNETPRDEWTITGLALALDTSRKVLLDYENMEENDLYSDIEEDDRAFFSNTIKKAKELIENSYEIDLKKSGRTGTIFALKNFGWKDSQQIDHTTKDKPIAILNGISTNDSNKQDTETQEEN